LRLSENRLLRRIFGPKREEVAGGWRRLHNEELHNLHASSIVITVPKSESEIDEACRTNGKDEKSIKNFCRKT
jgi:hypothetical protein